jgi:replicative DNA helicase
LSITNRRVKIFRGCSTINFSRDYFRQQYPYPVARPFSARSHRWNGQTGSITQSHRFGSKHRSLCRNPNFQNLNLTPLANDCIRQKRAKLKALDANEIETIVRVMTLSSELPLYLNGDRDIKVFGIASECRRLISEGKKLGLVVVDYLQMMASDSGGNRSYELGDVARELYKMAGDLNVPVLALSQINRAVESRQNKRPTMADLSQSGVLEMVADNAILLYRDEYYDSNTEDSEILELIVGKARHGSTGTVKVLFDRAYGLLKNLI